MKATEPPATAFDIGRRLELFLDDRVIDRLDGVALRMHAPQRMPLPEHPLTGAYMTVIKDGDLYRSYFRRYKPRYDGPLTDGNPGECTCTAESRDGIEWEEPALDLFEDEGLGRVRNAVLCEAPFAHNLSPFLDTRPGVPEGERFKALAGKRSGGLFAFVSADGIHWRRTGDEPVIRHDPALHALMAFDSQNVSFWSEAEGRYVCFFRHWNRPCRETKHTRGVLRSVGRAVSDDFLTWHDDSAAFRTPNFDAEDLYTTQTHPYFRAPHLYVALATRFVHGVVHGRDAADESGKLLNLGSTDIMLMSARAGADHFDRLFPEAFMRPGPEPAGWESRANYVALNVVPTGATEISIYNCDGHRYALRTDGFVSVNAPWRGGEMVTKPLRFEGKTLCVNLSTSVRGELRVELQDASGRALPGCGLGDCMPMLGDGIEEAVAWTGEADPGRYAGQPVRIRFVMRDCDLYAFRFQ